MHPADVDAATYDFVMTAAIEPEGRRSGRRATKVDRHVALEVEALWRSLDHDGKPSLSLGQIADRLNADPTVPPRPGRTDQPWTGPAIKGLLRTLRNQRQILLRRLGSLLAVVAQRDGVLPADFRRLALEHQVEPYWIWDRYWPPLGSGPGPAISRVIRPLGPLDGRIVVYPNGWAVIELWRQIHEFEPEVQDVLEAMRHEDWTLGFEALYRVCERFDAPAEKVIHSGLVELDDASKTFRATREGTRVGERWGLIVSDQEEGRWDAEYQPTPEELNTLPSDWDWDDRPLLSPPTPPSDSLGPA
jgi:hypothetical protein